MEVFLITDNDEFLLCDASDYQEPRDERYMAARLLEATQLVVESWLANPGQEYTQDFRIVIK